MSSKKRGNGALVVIVLIAMLTAAGAGVAAYKGKLPFVPKPPTIAQIIANSDTLNGQEVELRGVVRDGADLFGHGGFRLEDESDSIWVTTHQGTPRSGRTVTVTGRVKRSMQVPEVLSRFLGRSNSEVVTLEEIERK